VVYRRNKLCKSNMDNRSCYHNYFCSIILSITIKYFYKNKDSNINTNIFKNKYCTNHTNYNTYSDINLYIYKITNNYMDTNSNIKSVKDFNSIINKN